MNINPNPLNFPGFAPPNAKTSFNPNALHLYTHEELIQGGQEFHSPLRQAICSFDWSLFDKIIAIVGQQALRVPIIKEGNITAIQLMLNTNRSDGVSRAVQLMGLEVLMEQVSITAEEMAYDLTIPIKLMESRESQLIPYLHYFCRMPKTYVKRVLREYILSLATPEMLTTALATKPYQGLMPVHMAFATGNIDLMALFMVRTDWDRFNQPAAIGPWEGFLPAHLYLHNFLCKKTLRMNVIHPDHMQNILRAGPVLSGPYEGYLPIHLAAVSPHPKSVIREIVDLCGLECLEKPIPAGRNQGQTALALAGLNKSPDALQSFQNILHRLATHSLTSTVQPANPQLEYTNEALLQETIILSADEVAADFHHFKERIVPNTEYRIPLLHQLFRRNAAPSDCEAGQAHLKLATTAMLTTAIQEGPYESFTPVHMAFLTGHPQMMDLLMQRSDWNQINQPVLKGPWEGLRPAHLFMHNTLFHDPLSKRPGILHPGPVPSGAFEGYQLEHFAALASVEKKEIMESLSRARTKNLGVPIPTGKNQGITALSLAEKNPNPDVRKYFIPSALPHPIQNDHQRWIKQKLKELKKNPEPLLEEFKKHGLLDYSVYGTAFYYNNHPAKPYLCFKNSHEESVQKLYHATCSNPHPDGLLEAIAGAVYHLHECLISQWNTSNPNATPRAIFVPLMVYTQHGHEVRAHIAMSLTTSSTPTILAGVTPLGRQKAIDAVKAILGESPYRFEEGQIVMDLEGFAKLTDHMKKPGLHLIIIPRMAEPEPEEENPFQVTQVRPPRNLEMNTPRSQDEPASLKRKLKIKENAPKRVKVPSPDPVPGGVDRRHAMTTGAITTRFDEVERISPPAKRVKQGKLEAVQGGKTVDMPELAFDAADPAFFLKNLMKGSLEGTLNNLKTAQARSALIEHEPLPMPIAERLSTQAPVTNVHPLTSLMGYQKDALLNILTLSQQGLMPLLSLEMGLGKTYVFREWILQQIMAHRGGRHLIIVPASVKEQTMKVLQDAFSDLTILVRKIARNQAPNTTGFSHEQLSSVFKFQPTPVLVPTRKEMKAALERENAILIVNYEILDALNECAGHDQLTSLVADEAQRVHNDQSQTFKTASELASVQKKREFRPLMVTATPFENNLSELWTLLSLANPGQVPEETQRTLIAGLLKLKENLFDSIQGEAIDGAFLIHVFAHYKAFQQLLKKLVIYKKTTDPQVVQDWEGRVPTRQDESPEVELAPPVLEALTQATQELIQKKSHLQFNAKSNAALIHTSLIGQSIKDESPAIQALYRNAEEGSIETLIQESSFLKLLFAGDDPILQRCYRDNMKALVFVDHYATGKLIQIGADRLFNKKVEFLNGQCSAEEKNRLTGWFEGTNEPRILVLSMKAGGVGLNLPSARLVVDLSQDYNIAQHYQAVARAIRANNEGEVKVIRPLFRGSFYQAHVNAHQAKKAKWMEFYFGEGTFNQFVEALFAETAIDLLNKNKNLETTAQGILAMRTAYASLEIDASSITEAVAQAAYPVAPLPPPPPLRLDLRQYLQIPLPYGTPREDAIRIAKAFQNPDGNALIQDYMASKKAADQQRITAEAIRTAIPNEEDSVASSCLMLALQILENRQTQISAESLSGKDFIFREGHLESTLEDQIDEGIYLYKKQLPCGSFHYEPLIDKAVANVFYPVAPPAPPAPIRLAREHYVQIPLPYGTPREDAIRLAKAFQNGVGNGLIEDYLASKQDADQKRITAEAIRTANPNEEDSVESRCLSRALQIIENRQMQIPAESLSGKDFIFRGDSFESTPEVQMDEGIYLYKKQLPDGSFHYEPLIAKR